MACSHSQQQGQVHLVIGERSERLFVRHELVEQQPRVGVLLGLTELVMQVVYLLLQAEELLLAAADCL